jgi:hypothetical protein
MKAPLKAKPATIAPDGEHAERDQHDHRALVRRDVIGDRP